MFYSGGSGEWDDEERMGELDNLFSEDEKKQESSDNWNIYKCTAELTGAKFSACEINCGMCCGSENNLKVSDLFPAQSIFPHSAELSDEEIHIKLISMKYILNRSRIFIGLRPELPESLIYDYIVNEVFKEPVTMLNPNCAKTIVFDGCSGVCEGCFQRKFCDISEKSLTLDTNKPKFGC